jgi:hypothetical protein
LNGAKPVKRRCLVARTHAEIFETISGDDGYCSRV